MGEFPRVFIRDPYYLSYFYLCSAILHVDMSPEKFFAGSELFEGLFRGVKRGFPVGDSAGETFHLGDLQKKISTDGGFFGMI